MKVSVVISACSNREKMFRRSLDTWSKQNFSKDDFEIVIVDDADRTELKKICIEYNKNKKLNFQYINIDNNKSIMPVTTFIPVLSNNVGFRQARGEVILLTGPETLQSENNLKVAYSMKDRTQCGYGLVWKSSSIFVDEINKNWQVYKEKPFYHLTIIYGAKNQCYTKPPHPPAYYYLMAVAKKYIEKVGGIDERFAAGYCAEDDDLANRLNMSGIQPVFEHKMIGIHQDHSREDSSSESHTTRYKTKGIELRQRNINLMNTTLISGKFLANKLEKNHINYDPDYVWGDPRVIVNKEIF